MSVNTTTCSIDLEKPLNHRWLLGLVMVAVIALGWKYPLLGFAVPAAMAAGIIGGFFRGRWVCGNLCPRGSFLETWFSLVSANKEIPAGLKNRPVRWMILAALMGLMVFRLSQNLGSASHWGIVFWQMCLLTTVVAVGLGLKYNARSWCAICPVGTMAGGIGARRYPLQVHSSCKACGHCEKRCPMGLEIVKYRNEGVLREADCLKCSACMRACPSKNVLNWPG